MEPVLSIIHAPKRARQPMSAQALTFQAAVCKIPQNPEQADPTKHKSISNPNPKP